MREIGAFEAKNTCGQLLDWVESGEEVMITRHGKEVARLVPAHPIVNREKARAALQRIRARAEQRELGRFDWPEWNAYRMKAVHESRSRQFGALAWIYDNESTEAIRAVFNQIADAGAVVLTLWRLEVANGLTVAVRRNRIDMDFRDAALADLALLDIAIDQHTESQAWNETSRLADRFRLTLYDAAYLELVTRRKLRLAIPDHDLRAAATTIGTRILGGSRVRSSPLSLRSCCRLSCSRRRLKPRNAYWNSSPRKSTTSTPARPVSMPQSGSPRGARRVVCTSWPPRRHSPSPRSSRNSGANSPRPWRAFRDARMPVAAEPGPVPSLCVPCATPAATLI